MPIHVHHLVEPLLPPLHPLHVTLAALRRRSVERPHQEVDEAVERGEARGGGSLGSGFEGVVKAGGAVGEDERAHERGVALAVAGEECARHGEDGGFVGGGLGAGGLIDRRFRFCLCRGVTGCVHVGIIAVERTEEHYNLELGCASCQDSRGLFGGASSLKRLIIWRVITLQDY